MVSVCTGLLGEEDRVSTSVDTRLETEYLYGACSLYQRPVYGIRPIYTHLMGHVVCII